MRVHVRTKACISLQLTPPQLRCVGRPHSHRRRVVSHAVDAPHGDEREPEHENGGDGLQEGRGCGQLRGRGAAWEAGRRAREEGGRCPWNWLQQGGWGCAHLRRRQRLPPVEDVVHLEIAGGAAGRRRRRRRSQAQSPTRRASGRAGATRGAAARRRRPWWRRLPVQHPAAEGGVAQRGDRVQPAGADRGLERPRLVLHLPPRQRHRRRVVDARRCRRSAPWQPARQRRVAAEGVVGGAGQRQREAAQGRGGGGQVGGRPPQVSAPLQDPSASPSAEPSPSPHRHRHAYAYAWCHRRRRRRRRRAHLLSTTAPNTCAGPAQGLYSRGSSSFRPTARPCSACTSPSTPF